MKERIIQFLKENSLSSTKFADIIGVQRSSISHILSGRNKPSFDFIEKMLLAFPDLNAQWLMIGKGNMFIKQLSLFGDNIANKPKNSPLLESNNLGSDINSEHIANSDGDIVYKTKNTPLIDNESEKIERIVIFYSNGKFKEYKPT